MKIKTKKISSLFLIVILVVSSMLIGSVSANAVIYTSGDYQYTCNYSGNNIASVNIVGYKGSVVNLQIPSSFTVTENGKTKDVPVTSIGYDAFRDYKNLASVNIPNTITEIGYGAFHNCANLSDINITESVTTIGDFAFSGCVSIKDIKFGNSLKTLGKFSFYGCNGLSSVNLPDNITYIDDSAFADCQNLTKIYMGNGVTDAGDLVFSGCKSLTDLTIGKKLKSIGYMMFKECGLKTLTIPEGVTNIEFGAFKDCKELTAVYVPSTLRSIDYSVFENCNNISSVYGDITKIEIGKNNDAFVNASKNTTPYSNSDSSLKAKGDINNDKAFNILDVTYYQKWIAKIIDKKYVNSNTLDYNGDGKTNINDATAMQRALAKKI